jgi:catechol 2,3-dioxygenase-like lactoylglutathione lyase family enzyme
VPSVTGIYHGGITVSDMDRSLRFYAEGLGLPVEFDVVAADRPYLREVLALDFSAMRSSTSGSPAPARRSSSCWSTEVSSDTRPLPARRIRVRVTCVSSWTTSRRCTTV